MFSNTAFSNWIFLFSGTMVFLSIPILEYNFCLKPRTLGDKNLYCSFFSPKVWKNYAAVNAFKTHLIKQKNYVNIIY